jgi:hypothetical protein
MVGTFDQFSVHMSNHADEVLWECESAHVEVLFTFFSSLSIPDRFWSSLWPSIDGFFGSHILMQLDVQDQ